MWHTGARISGLRSLDVDDFRPEDFALDFVHRPESDTPLKNKKKSNRSVAISGTVTQVLADFIQQNRRMKIDENDREPLFTTVHGRCTRNTMRRMTYALTHPCVIGDCPHGEIQRNCVYREHGRQSSCPSALSPHRIRTGAISYMREEGMPVEDVAERVDATPETIRTYYDRSDEEQRREQRRKQLEQIDI